MIRIAATTLSLTLLSSSTFAGSPSEWCAQWGDFARATMAQRQHGTPINKAVSALAEMESSGTTAQDMAVARMIVVAAWQTPLSTTDRMADVTIYEFGEQTFLNCLKATTK